MTHAARGANILSGEAQHLDGATLAASLSLITPRRTTIQLIVLFKSGDPEVHRAECPEWPHTASHGSVTLDVESLTALATEVAADFLEDGSMTQEQAYDWLREGLRPCAIELAIGNHGARACA